MLRIIVASDTILKKDNKFLLVQESKEIAKGKWNLPGGRIELEEDIITCTKREVEEETGIKTKPEYLVGIYQIWPKPKRNVIVFVFKSEILSSKSISSEEIMDMKWLSLDEIKELNKKGLLRSSYVLKAIEDYIAKKKIPLEFINIQD